MCSGNTRDVSRAPMRSESYKRFAIYKKKEKRTVLSYLFDWLIKGIIIGLLISINFVLFASSSNYSLFADNVYVFPNIILPVIIIFALSIGTMFFISFSNFLENLLVSFVVGLFIYVTINQFMTLSPDSFLYSIFYTKISPNFAQNFINNSDLITSLIIAIITMIVLSMSSNSVVFSFAIILTVAFTGIVVDEYANKANKKEFVTLYEKKSQETTHKGSNFIYLMIPNATSYTYLTDLEAGNPLLSDEVKKTKNIMLGFYAKNNFTMYPNIYVEEQDPFMNIVKQFNMLNNKKVEDIVLNQIMIDGLMKFKNYNEKHVFLEENMLFNKFKNANYRVNVYQSHGIELCQTNSQIIADKCVEKQNHPFNFQNMDISELEKTKLLLLQWVNSTKLLKDLSGLYSFLNIFTDANKMALVGISYDNLHIINSINTLDILANDIIMENNNSTYFALLDVPGEMYVYDEFCKIKPKETWLSKNNLPWIKANNEAERQKAYFQQTRCLYAKLEFFVNKLKEHNLDKNSVIVIQGISGLNAKITTTDVLKDFRNKKSVIMAIYEPKKTSFALDYGMCNATTVLIKYLYGKNICRNADLFKNLPGNVISDIQRDLTEKEISESSIYDAENTFVNWYSDWAKVHNIPYAAISSPIRVTPSSTEIKNSNEQHSKVDSVVNEVKKENNNKIETVEEITEKKIIKADDIEKNVEEKVTVKEVSYVIEETKEELGSVSNDKNVSSTSFDEIDEMFLR